MNFQVSPEVLLTIVLAPEQNEGSGANLDLGAPEKLSSPKGR